MAIKHNNMIPNVHFRKWWQRYVKTWFNQAGRKHTRRNKREVKKMKCAPRPIGKLRPEVHPPTKRYNFKTRFGKGFTMQELKTAKIAKKAAQGLGIAIDHRRTNHCQESLDLNVARLQAWQKNMLLMPIKGKAKKGETARKDVKDDGKFASGKHPMPLVGMKKRTKAEKITADQKSTSAYKVLRKARTDKKMFGKRFARARDKAAAEKQKK